MEKEYIETPFNYTGSKFNLLSQLLPEFDYTKQNFVDMFSGGGSVWTNVVDNYQNIFINDIIFELIQIQKLLIKDYDYVINKIYDFYYIEKNDQNKYLEMRDMFNKTRDPYIFYSLLLSCTNNMIRFNKKWNFNQTFGKRSMNENTINKIKNGLII